MSSVIHTELSSFIAQGKKRNAELKNSAEISLRLLEALPDASNLSDLRQHKEFVTPFLIACTSSNAKSCASALQCLQIIASADALAPERLDEVLSSLSDAASLGIAIQLKVLQLLPVLLACYSDSLKGDLLSRLLEVCAELNKDHKASMVSNTTYATLQQLITSLFDRISDEKPENNDLEIGNEIFKLNDNVYDAVRILLDLCEIAEHNPPNYLRINDLPTTFTLELLELTLTNHSAVFHGRVFRKLLSSRIIPLLLRLYSEASNDFALVIRVARMFYLLIRKHLDSIAVEAEVILNTLALTCKNSTVIWKKILCLEVFQGVFSDSNLLLLIFTKYRQTNSATLHDIIDCLSAALVNSRIPMAVDSDDSISKANNPKVACIELLDKTDPPEFKRSYFYYLIMVCVNALGEGLAKISSASRKSEGDVEKVTELLKQIQVPLTNCFTALLVGSMDIDLFKALVKAVQRIAHVCGVNNLSDQRDEYITILVQHSFLPEDEGVRKRLLQRNIFCVRALFNLGFALGNKLGPSWSLIIDCIGRIASQINPGFTPHSGEFFGGSEEYRPIELSLKRMLDQTSDLEDEALGQIVTIMLRKKDLIFFACTEYLVSVNSDRFFNLQLWQTFSTQILKHICNESLELSVRVHAATCLDNSVLSVMKFASDGEELRATIKTLYSQVQVDSNEIRLQAVTTMNKVLDQFFSSFESGWVEIFEIISYVAQKDAPQDLYKTTFEALTLICHDFLENLPYSCIFDLTLCLDQFSRQNSDLNTSFTATSLFWSVCDYLVKSQSMVDVTDFEVHNEESLIAFAKDEHSDLKQYALWMLAEIKLAQIASEPQHQIKTGAAQIFFRLFEAHSKKLPDVVWDRCQELVFPEIMNVKVDEDPANANETYSIIVDGLGSIFSSNITRSGKGLVPVLDYFSKVCSISTSNVMATLNQTSLIVDAYVAKKVHDDSLVNHIWSYWIHQNPFPAHAQTHSKLVYDSLELTVNLFPRIHDIMKMSTDQVKEAISLLVKCARYNSKTSKLSSLQEQTLNQLKYIWEKHDETEVQIALLESVGDLSVFCFKPNIPSEPFLPLSQRSQELLNKFVSSSSSHDAAVLKNMVIIMEKSTDRSQAIDTYLLILERSKDRNAIADDVVSGGCSIVSGGPEGESRTEAIGKFFSIIEDDTGIDTTVWKKLLVAVTINTLLYQRGHYFHTKFFEGEEPAPKEIYGSIEREVPNKRNEVSYYCLDLLMKLSKKSTDYAKIARKQYIRRIQLVLLQTIGDSKLRGAEPMSTLLREELLFILNQLRANKGTFSKETNHLLLNCITIRDHRALSTLQDILTYDA